MVQSETSSKEHTVDCTPIPIQDSMVQSIEDLRAKIGSKVTNATILAVLQDNPCLVKCITDITSPDYGGKVDQFYIARHDFARISIVDRIAQVCHSGFEVGAEQSIRTGKLDVSIMNQKIVISNGSPIIGLEVKSGQGIDLFQLLRYLFEVPKLIVVRVPTTDVTLIKRSDIINELDKAALSIQEKANKLIDGHQYKVAGPWCYECKAECEYRKKRASSPHVASMDGLASFINNVGITVEKTMTVLKKELAEY